ncbi:MAG: hypothetical protein J6386_13465 [Candidatus Synoicihabitans palmerolidicus]|nr:hypothetical protein [Candidatus Synoicihabitans palmerolidicus]
MPNEPPVFAKQMNRWCIAMTHSRRRRDAKRARKGVLRQMKRLLRTIGEHARRHRDHLAADYARTRFSERQAIRIIARIDARLEQLPAAIKQAHERIIGARPVPNAEKILRVYEPDVQTVVRGKASGEVEFGYTLMISENVTGLITDWQLYQGGNGSGRMASVRPEPRALESVRPEHPDQSGEHRPRLLDQTAVRTLGRSRHL